ncbi:hypothetical protein ACFRFL_44290 [Streptomyces sp. NPDC056708]|uniref:hypothetical protein n=1 Tax=unclassified Streptomyces TaxID=2593676 RepID=UPI0036BE3762
MVSDTLARLSASGVSIWLDDLSRQRPVDGSLVRLVAYRNVAGVTTHPTIVARAIETSDCYGDQIADLSLRQVGVEEVLRALTSTTPRGTSWTWSPRAWSASCRRRH